MLNRPILIVMVGIPASGKSYKAKELSELYNANIYSSDTYRKELLGDENCQDNNELVFNTLFNDIYYDLCNALGVDREPVFGPDRAGDIKHSNADISKAKEKLGYDPEYDFAKGIALAIDWYKANL